MPKTSSKSASMTSSTCIIYCRVSSFNQSSESSCSLEAQETLSKKMAKSKGYRIKKVCKEVGSAYKSSMKSLKEILVSNKSTHILMYDVSRFCRGVVNGLKMLDMALSKNNTLVFVYDKLVINAKNKESRLPEFTSLLEQSERESAKISSRIKTAQQYLRDQGKYAGGCLPYGYSVTKSTNPSKNNILVEDPSEQNIMAFINLCRKPMISSQKLNDRMKKISPQIPYIKINCYDKDQETVLTTINTSLTNGEIAGLLNDYSVKKRGRRWSVASVRNTKVEAGIELKLSNMPITAKIESDDESDDESDYVTNDESDDESDDESMIQEPLTSRVTRAMQNDTQPQGFPIYGYPQFQPHQFQQFQPQQFQQFQPQQFQQFQPQQFPRFGFQHVPPAPPQPKKSSRSKSRKNNLQDE